MLLLLDEKGKAGVISMYVDGRGNPSLVFGDTSGRNRAWFGVGGDRDPILELRDKNYQSRVVLRADRSPTLTILDKDGKVAWSAP